ncbi:MAG: bifunctional serine/threonine-protein kinase/formylglycine-generating enzyme family protein [Gemmataceae bacterium]
MSADSGLAGLPLDAVLRVNARCDAFEAALRAGGRARPNEFLGDATGAERDALLDHLTAVAADYYEATPDEFARRLAAEGLLPDPFDATGTTAELADRLISAGALTAYQAGVLRSARPHPLALNDYLILDRVAAGGMGTVYRAVHRRMRREVALKVVADGGWFRREAEAAGRLAHPHIVTAYDAGEARGVSYLASEFVAGTDLRRWVLEHGPLSVPEAVRATRDAAAGLAYAHGCGVIHRDVKPANLIRTPAGEVRVLDVGLARVAHRAGSADDLSLVVGTPGYMAPEQTADPAAVGARADVYALGRTLAFLLTGRTPAGDDTPLSPDAPPALAALCRRMTAPDPADRPASMADVLAALDAVSRRRNLWVGALVCLVCAAGFWVAFWPRWDDPPPPPLPPRPLPQLRDVPFDGAAYQAEWAAALGLPVEVEPIPGLKARLIPPGRFLMGTPADPLDGWIAAERNDTVREHLRGETARAAEIPVPIYVATTETTVALFRRFVTAQSPPYRTTAERDGGVGYRLKADGSWAVEPGPTWMQAGEQPVTDAHPVGNLGRDDCADFCRWLTRELGGRYECRLPTEAEWEYACRAGEPGLWACGSDPAGLGSLAWFTGTVDATDGRYRPVGRKAPNRFGLFDVHGNLEEWCGDGGGVLRGGHVRSGAGGVRSAARAPAKPVEPRGGFRVALVAVGR